MAVLLKKFPGGNMKRVLLIMIFLIIVTGLVASQADEKYPLVKNLIKAQIEMLEKLTKSDETIKDASSAAIVLNRFNRDMTDMIPLISELAKKHKNFQEMFGENAPEEIKKEMDKLQELGRQMSDSFGKIMGYAKDPVMQKPIQKMKNLQAEIEKIIADETKKRAEKKKNKSGSRLSSLSNT